MATIAGMHNKEAAESIAAPPANSKLVPKLSFSVSSAVAGDFNHWLSTHLKTVLELPGMLGAKVMQPVSTTVDAAPPAGRHLCARRAWSRKGHAVREDRREVWLHAPVSGQTCCGKSASLAPSRAR